MSFLTFGFVCSDLFAAVLSSFLKSSGCPICCKLSVQHRQVQHLRKESLARTSNLEEFTEILFVIDDDRRLSHHRACFSPWAKVFIAHGSSGRYQDLKGAGSCSPGCCRWQAGCSKTHWKHRAACRRIIDADRHFKIFQKENSRRRDFQKNNQ